MLTYSQTIGIFTMPDGTTYHGHAGKGAGLNNPEMQNVHGVGPLPQGLYNLETWKDGSAYSAEDARLGPFVCRLDPDPANEMYGRNGFFLHGGDGSNPPTDSEGCIVLFRAAREAIAATGETQLTVVA